MIVCHELHKHFGGFRAVDGLSLEIPAGAITGLIGPNGAGKTTLFNVIAGLYKPTSGRVTMAGEDITGLPPHELFAKGLLRTFQIAREFSSMTVDRKSTRLNSSHVKISYAVFCLKKKKHHLDRQITAF